MKKTYMNKISHVALGALIIGSTLVTTASATDSDDLVINDLGVMDQTALSDAAGLGDLQTQASDVNQNAALEDNTLTAAETGKNIIDGGSFDNLQGIAHVIQNSGNNVIIQDNTTFNIQFVEAAN